MRSEYGIFAPGKQRNKDKMTIDYDAYEIVVGLEVHAQLLTQTKLFCGIAPAWGEPNTHVKPRHLGHPGSLPKLNRKAIEFRY